MDSKIDCSSVYCPPILDQLNSCPRKQITFTLENSNLSELFIIGISLSPYIITFSIVMTVIFRKTVRSICLLGLIIIQNFIIKLIKDLLRDPRPNYQCKRQFGNPSNHTTFYISFLIWIIMEQIYLNEKFAISKFPTTLLLIIAIPFVFNSQLYLRYNSIDQLFCGACVGFAVGLIWFYIVNSTIIDSNSENPVKKILIKYRFHNNLSQEPFISTDYTLLPEGSIYRQFLELSDKEREISKIKNNLKKFTSQLNELDIIQKAREKHHEDKNK